MAVKQTFRNIESPNRTDWRPFWFRFGWDNQDQVVKTTVAFGRWSATNFALS